jgi:hypothetical protein
MRGELEFACVYRVSRVVKVAMSLQANEFCFRRRLFLLQLRRPVQQHGDGIGRLCRRVDQRASKGQTGRSTAKKMTGAQNRLDLALLSRDQLRHDNLPLPRPSSQLRHNRFGVSRHGIWLRESGTSRLRRTAQVPFGPFIEELSE